MGGVNMKYDYDNSDMVLDGKERNTIQNMLEYEVKSDSVRDMLKDNMSLAIDSDCFLVARRFQLMIEYVSELKEREKQIDLQEKYKEVK